MNSAHRDTLKSNFLCISMYVYILAMDYNDKNSIFTKSQDGKIDLETFFRRSVDSWLVGRYTNENNFLRQTNIFDQTRFLEFLKAKSEFSCGKSDVKLMNCVHIFGHFGPMCTVLTPGCNSSIQEHQHINVL